MKKVLVIEDDKMIKTILNHLLGKEGYLIDFAMDGEEGARKLLHTDPDVVITDIQLPHVSGMTLVTLSKKLNPNRPVFVVSSLGSEAEIVEEALEQGANEVLTKPIAFEDIAEKIRNVLLLEAV